MIAGWLDNIVTIASQLRSRTPRDGSRRHATRAPCRRAASARWQNPRSEHSFAGYEPARNAHRRGSASSGSCRRSRSVENCRMPVASSKAGTLRPFVTHASFILPGANPRRPSSKPGYRLVRSVSGIRYWLSNSSIARVEQIRRRLPFIHRSAAVCQALVHTDRGPDSLLSYRRSPQVHQHAISGVGDVGIVSARCRPGRGRRPRRDWKLNSGFGPPSRARAHRRDGARIVRVAKMPDPDPRVGPARSTAGCIDLMRVPSSQLSARAVDPVRTASSCQRVGQKFWPPKPDSPP